MMKAWKMKQMRLRASVRAVRDKIDVSRHKVLEFLVDALGIKEPDNYRNWFLFSFVLSFLKTKLDCNEIFVQFVQLNEYLGNESKLLQMVPLPFLLFKRSKNGRV